MWEVFVWLKANNILVCINQLKTPISLRLLPRVRIRGVDPPSTYNTMTMFCVKQIKTRTSWTKENADKRFDGCLNSIEEAKVKLSIEGNWMYFFGQQNDRVEKNKIVILK